MAYRVDIISVENLFMVTLNCCNIPMSRSPDLAGRIKSFFASESLEILPGAKSEVTSDFFSHPECSVK